MWNFVRQLKLSIWISFNKILVLLFEVSDEFVSTERVELDFLAVETAEESKEEEVMDETELSFLDSKEFFFTAETDFDLEVLLIELRDSAVVSSVDSAETVKNSRQKK